MRIFKIILLVVLLFAGYVFIIEPMTWYSSTRRQSVRVLKAARSRGDLPNAVGQFGLFISLTNNGWIAIRYRDSHYGGVRSCAVALDSGGGWFESDFHFCGSLRCWPHMKEEVAAEEEQKSLDPKSVTNQISVADSPSYRQLASIENAPDLMSARRALLRTGFKELNQ